MAHLTVEFQSVSEDSPLNGLPSAWGFEPQKIAVGGIDAGLKAIIDELAETIEVEEGHVASFWDKSSRGLIKLTPASLSMKLSTLYDQPSQKIADHFSNTECQDDGEHRIVVAFVDTRAATKQVRAHLASASRATPCLPQLDYGRSSSDLAKARLGNS